MSAVSQSCPSCKAVLPSDRPAVRGQISCPECGMIMAAPQPANSDGRWSYAHGGKKYGPFPLAELRRLAATGHFQRTDMVLQEGTTKWVSADSIPSLFPPNTASLGPPPVPAQVHAGQPSSPSQGAPSVAWASGSPPTSPGAGKRTLDEILATCRTPFTQTARLVRYGQLKWRLRSLRREARAARLALGQRAYETGAGDPQLRSRIAAIDEEIGRLESAKSSTKHAKAEREQILLKVAEQVQAIAGPLRGVEAAWERVGLATAALRDQQSKVTEAAKRLKPEGTAEWRRVLVGVTGAIVLSVIVLLVVFKPRGPSADGSVGSTNKDSESERTRNAVLRVMEADDRLSQKLNRLPPGTRPTQLAQPIGHYCAELETLDMSGCPADFRVAYKQHIRAWRAMQVAVREQPDDLLEGAFMLAVNFLLRGERDGGETRLADVVKTAAERVRITWEEVERTGAKYGAAL